jgi:hypothetical protein
VTLVRRRQREVYRVFGEDEFFDGGYAGEPLESVTIVGGEGRLRRVAGMAMLAGALGAAGGLIALNSLPRGKRVARGVSLAGARGGSGLRGGSRAGARAGSNGQVLSARVLFAGAHAAGSVRGSRPRDTERARCAGRMCAHAARRDAEIERDEPSPIEHPRSAVPATASASPVDVATESTPTESTPTGSTPTEDTPSEGAPTPPEFGFER